MQQNFRLLDLAAMVNSIYFSFQLAVSITPPMFKTTAPFCLEHGRLPKQY
jgi:hypothetical protein